MTNVIDITPRILQHQIIQARANVKGFSLCDHQARQERKAHNDAIRIGEETMCHAWLAMMHDLELYWWSNLTYCAMLSDVRQQAIKTLMRDLPVGVTSKYDFIKALKCLSKINGSDDALDWYMRHIPAIETALSILTRVQSGELVVVPTLSTLQIEKAMLESEARDDEGGFPCMLDLVGFSGENKNYTVIREAYRAGVKAAPSIEELMGVTR